MTTCRAIHKIEIEFLYRLIVGYSSNSKFAASVKQSENQLSITLTRIALDQPYIKLFGAPGQDIIEHYQSLAKAGYCFGAFDAELCIGIAIAEPTLWNRSLRVHELHVAESHREQGIGRQLMDNLTSKATSEGLRIIVCETQNTNAQAIQFYQKLGFRMEGVDTSFYTNNDLIDGEIAVFMKKQL